MIFLESWCSGVPKRGLKFVLILVGGLLLSVFGVPKISAALTAGSSNLPATDVVDVSSHQGTISVADFKKMKSYGVKAVIVKLTEYTTYQNPYAPSQIANAKAAGLKIGVYHYSWFTTTAQAQAEAKYFVAYAQKLGLPKDTLMVDDLEDTYTNTNDVTKKKADVTANAKAFYNQIKAAGYTNQALYTNPSYQTSTALNFSFIGNKHVWMSQWPANPSGKNLLQTSFGMWQWSDSVNFPGVTGGPFDVSVDYGLFPPVVTYKYTNAKTGKQIGSTVKSYTAGQTTTPITPAIAGYTTPTVKPITVGNKNQTITIVYTPKTVTTTYKYVNAKNGKILKSVPTKYYTGQTVTDTLPDFTGYTKPKSATFTQPATAQTRTIKYTPKTYTTAYTYIDKRTNKVLKKVSQKYYFDQKVTPYRPAIKGYTAPAATSFTMNTSAAATKRTVKYAKNQTVTYKYVDSRSNKVVKTVTKTYYDGQKIKTYLPSITGYQAPKVTTFTVSNKNTTRTVKYTPKTYTVTYKYVNAKTGHTLAKNKQVKVYYNRKTTPVVAKIAHYKAAKVSALTIKKNTTYTIKYTYSK